jgi:hypothetical protein
MQRLVFLFKATIILIAISILFSCKKEHLDPAIPSINSEPLIYVSTNLNGDSIYHAGGVNDYAGVTSYFDTINRRTFNFTLRNVHDTSNSYFKISINNYKNILGVPQEDLDSTIYASNRTYNGGLLGFNPLSATIYWIDSTGLQFKSTPATPNIFSIISVEDTIYNSKKYKITKIEFECFLQDFNNTIHLTNGKATVLFSVD